MYLSLGADMAVRASSIVGIFDLDNTTCSKHTRAFLKKAEAEGQVVAAGEELPKSFVLNPGIRHDPGLFKPIQRRHPGKAAE